jgi:radical SAM superfamily enzyme
MENTVRFVCDCGIWGIKIHLLHVLSGPDLAEDYLGGNFVCMEKNEYLETICSLLTVIPENVVIHRLTGDGDKKKLIAPLWSANKKDVLNSLNAMLRDRNIVQGSNI